jgi:uncharacterized protein GlcG (DUF336 family)
MTIIDTISAVQANRILAAAQAHAASIRVAANIAVLDGGAHLKAFIRMDRAVLGSIDLAIGKARTAVLFGTTSEAVWDYCKPGAPAHNLEASNSGLMPFAGGLPLLSRNDALIGAVGVSGGTVPEDLAIAEAAVAALGS